MTEKTRHTGLDAKRDAGPGGTLALTTKVSLQLPPEMSYDEWARTGHQLTRVVSSTAWWLGDWLIYGRAHYSDRYERAIQSAGLRYQTLRNYAWVAGGYPASRRRIDLSFQHHAELASLSVPDQERWLQRATDEGWSLRDLRRAVREARDGYRAIASPGMRRLAVPDEQLRRWHDAAARAGADLEEWVMATLDNAAEQILTGLVDQ